MLLDGIGDGRRRSGEENGTAAASQLWLSADKTYTKSYMMYDTILAYDGETVKSFVEYSLNG